MNQQVVLTPIDTLIWPAMPDPQDRPLENGGVWVWPESKIEAFEQIDPQNVSGYAYLVFPFSLAVYDEKGDHILSIVIEQTDYRVLSEMTGESLKEYTQESKEYLSTPHIIIFTADARYEFGPYDNTLESEEVFDLLCETVSEYLDLWDDPIRKSLV